MTDESEKTEKPSNISKALLERRARADDAAYDIVLAKLWDGIQSHHNDYMASEIHYINLIVRKLNLMVSEIEDARPHPSPEIIITRCGQILRNTSKIYPYCQNDRRDTADTIRVRADLKKRITDIQVRACGLLNTFTLGTPESPDKLQGILLQNAGIINEEQRQAVFAALYPTSPKVVPLTPRRQG